MTRQTYEALIDQICAIEGIGDPSQLYRMAALQLGDIAFVMMPVSLANEPWAMFFIDYGPPPAERRDLALQRLLEANALDPDPLLPKFGMDAGTGHVLLTGFFKVGVIDPESFLKLLRHHAAQAAAWKASDFMTDDDDTPSDVVSSDVDVSTRRLNGARVMSSPRA